MTTVSFFNDIAVSSGDPNPDRYESANKRHVEIIKKDCDEYVYDPSQDEGLEDYVCSDTESFYE